MWINPASLSASLGMQSKRDSLNTEIFIALQNEE